MQNNKEKLLIIDGHNLLFQMYFGMPNKILGKNNIYIQGVIGFIGALRKIITMINPQKVLIVFDSETGGPRNLINENYKANRIDYRTIPAFDNPFSQLPGIFQCLEYLQIPFVEIPYVEADDVIASNALFYQKQYQIIISSFDSDYYQLINENISVFRYRGKKSSFINQETFQEKFKITPNYYLDYKSLVGDSADNIKGVPTIGPVTAASLINQFGSVEEIINNSQDIAKENLKIKISANQSLIRQNYELIKLVLKEELIVEIPYLTTSNQNFKTLDILKELKII